VDVAAVLSEMAEEKGRTDLNWRTSIVDLLKLLDLDASLQARKELAQELGVSAGEHGSAEQNMALQKAVMRKLAENGGQVPADLRD
jgi:cell wall assembly regulator SMI1